MRKKLMKKIDSKLITFQGEIMEFIKDILINSLKIMVEDQFKLTKKSVNECFEISIKNKEEVLKKREDLINKRLEKISKSYFS